jgi:hypothetical protein
MTPAVGATLGAKHNHRSATMRAMMQMAVGEQERTLSEVDASELGAIEGGAVPTIRICGGGEDAVCIRLG